MGIGVEGTSRTSSPPSPSAWTPRATVPGCTSRTTRPARPSCSRRSSWPACAWPPARTGWAGCASACTGASPDEPRARDHRPGDDADVGHRGYGQFYPGRRGGRRGAGRRRPRAGRRRRAAGGLQPRDPTRPAERRPGPPRRTRRPAPARAKVSHVPSKTETLVRDMGDGHSEIDYATEYRRLDEEFVWFGRLKREKVPGYIEALESAHGAAVAHDALVIGPPHTLIYRFDVLRRRN